MQLPPLLKLCVEMVRSTWFWLIFLLLILLGFLVRQLNHNSQDFVCELYGAYFEPKVNKFIEGNLVHAKAEASATEPADRSVDYQKDLARKLEAEVKGYFCVPAVNQTGFRVPTFDDVKVVLPASLVLAMLLWMSLPRPTSRSEITQHLSNADNIVEISKQIGNVQESEEYLKTIASRYVATALATRQLRTAILYAVLSGVATLAIRPAYSVSVQHFYTDLATNCWHTLAILLAAIIAAVYGAYGFSKTSIDSVRLALTLGFGSIFFGGVIATCISIPYQILRPLELHPMTTKEVLELLGTRLILIPCVAACSVLLMRPLMKLWPIRD